MWWFDAFELLAVDAVVAWCGLLALLDTADEAAKKESENGLTNAGWKGGALVGPDDDDNACDADAVEVIAVGLAETTDDEEAVLDSDELLPQRRHGLA